MNRRSFFGTMIGGLAASAAVRTWPFRVFSFSSEVVAPTFEIPAASQLLTIQMITAESLKILEQHLTFKREFPIGSVLRIRKPARFAWRDGYVAGEVIGGGAEMSL